MPRTCTICAHPNLQEIDESLVAGVPFRHIATRFDTSTGALQRHKNDHLPAVLVKGQESGEVARADDLLGQVRNLQQKALDILKTAEQAGDLKVALGAIREPRGCMDLLAKLVYVLAKDREGEESRVNWRFTIGKGYDDRQRLPPP